MMPAKELRLTIMSELSPRSSAASDRDILLLKRYFSCGDAAAMDKLFSRHAGAAYRLALAYLENTADAEDIVQAVFVQLLKNGNEEIRNVQGWIMRMVIDACRNKLKQEIRRRQRLHAMMETRSKTHETESANAETISAAVSAVEALPREYRLPVWLHHLEGVAFKDIGNALSLPDETVRKRASLGIELVRRSLAAAGFTAIVVPELLASSTLSSAPAELTASLKSMLASATAKGPGIATGAAPKAAKGAVAALLLAVVAAVAMALLVSGVRNESKVYPGAPRAASALSPAPGDTAVTVMACKSKNVNRLAELPSANSAGDSIPKTDDSVKPAVVASDDEIAASIDDLCSLNPERSAAADALLRGLGERARPALKNAAENGVGEVKARAELLLAVLGTRPLLTKILFGREATRGLLNVKSFDFAWSAASNALQSGSVRADPCFCYKSYDDAISRDLTFIDAFCCREQVASTPISSAKIWSSLIAPLVSMDNLRLLSRFVDFNGVHELSLDGRRVYILDGRVNESAWRESELYGEFVRLIGESSLEQNAINSFKVRLYIDQTYFVTLKTEISNSDCTTFLSGHFIVFPNGKLDLGSAIQQRESKALETRDADLEILTSAGACGLFGK